MAIVKRKRKDGTTTFLVRVRDPDGKWYESETYTIESEARSREAELLKKKETGKKSSKNDARHTTISEYYPVWVAECKSSWSKGWKKTQDMTFRKHVEPVIGDLTLAEVKIPDIGRVLNKMAGNGLAEQTRLHIYNLLAGMFADAKGYFEMELESPVKEEYHRPKVILAPREFLEPEQSWQLMDQAKKHAYAGPIVCIQLLAGLRYEAAVALQWGDIQYDPTGQGEDYFFIRRYWKKKIDELEPYPKNREPEFVPIAHPLKEYLLALRKSRPDDQDDDFITQGPRGGLLNYSTYMNALERLCEAAGLPRITTHVSRHSCTELWVRAGATEEDIRRLLNHKSSASTRRYIHRTNHRLRELGKGLRRLQVIQGGGLYTNPVHIVNERACTPPDSEAVSQ